MNALKNFILYILGIPLIIFSSCSGANYTGFDANRYSEHRSKTNFYPDIDPYDIDSTRIRPKPENSPNTEPTEDDEKENHDLKLI